MGYKYFGVIASVVALASALVVEARVSARPQGAGVKGVEDTHTIPRTANGRPDLHGTWTAFDTTPLEAPSPEDRARLAPLEESFPGISGEHRAITGPNPSAEFTDVGVKRSPRRRSLIVDPQDGRAPVRPEAMEKRAHNLAHLTDSWEFQTPWERCITRGVPFGMLPAGYNNGYQIMQNADYITIVYEMLHEPRVIPLDGRPQLGRDIRLWNGDSRGHWEGDTLVVDVTNYRAADSGTLATGISTTATLKSIPQSESMHVVERFTRVDADTIQWEMTIEDPKVYTRPWKVALPLNREDRYGVFEYACHEGNYGLPNALSGARAQEKSLAPGRRH